MEKLLEIKDLNVEVEGNKVLKDINLTVNKGEIHVLIGPNGAGKSSLMNAVMAHPKFKVTGGSIIFKGKDITDLETDERARLGIFLSFQNPIAIEGVKVEDFIRQALTAQGKDYGGIIKFRKTIKQDMEKLDLDPSYRSRYVNVGFSGGERKKNEILQLSMLNPDLALLDETDSGLDVDAVRIASKGIKDFFTSEKGIIIITHHAQILNGIDVDYVHVLKDGEIVKTADSALMDKVEKEGYGWLDEEAV